MMQAHFWGVVCLVFKVQKVLVSVNFFCPKFWGRKWVRQFYGRLEFLLSFCRKTSMSIKFLVLWGGGYLGFCGGVAQFESQCNERRVYEDQILCL